MAFTACGSCPHYERGAGDKKCLTCTKYKEITLQYQDRDTIRVVSLPQALMEAIGDSHHMGKGILWAMRLIDTEDLAVILLRHYGERSIREIAEGLKISERTVNNRLSRANAQLKTILNESNSSICDESKL